MRPNTQYITEAKWVLLTIALQIVCDEYMSLIGEDEPLIYSVECRGYFNLK